MIPVYQTDLSNETGDCLQACVASVLELPLAEVPEFKRINAYNPIRVAAKWLEELEYKVVLTSVKGLRYATFTDKCIVSVPSMQHKNTYHAVVARIEQDLLYEDVHLHLIHDPNAETLRIYGPITNARLAFLIYE